MVELYNCFFCCREAYNIGEEGTVFTAGSIDSCNNYCESVQKTIFQISHYLQVPKNTLITDQVNIATIRICKECRDISEHLGNLCSLLETTQLKINYYLNLLTDKILSKDETTDHQQENLLNFQETFHQKCLTKLAKIDANPVLQLTKCQTPVEPDNQVFIEFMGNSNDNGDISEEDENEPNTSLDYFEDFPEEPDDLMLKEDPDNYADINCLEEKDSVDEYIPKTAKKRSRKVNLTISCDYCPLTFRTSRNKDTHTLAVHLKKPSNKPGSHLIKPCGICGAMISSRNLSKHMKRHRNTFTPMRVGPKVIKFKRCESCGKMFEMGWKMGRHLRENKECGDKAKFRCSNCGRIFSRLSNLKRHLIESCENKVNANQVQLNGQSN